MSQTWSDNVPQASNDWDSDLSTMKAMFATLKSTFSGASAPSNPIAGMFWYDTTNHILKLRNEANTAWLNIWDLSNDKPYGQDFTDGSYLDGDKIDIDFTPAQYSPDASVPEADDVDDLAAHLKGIDSQLSTLQVNINDKETKMRHLLFSCRHNGNEWSMTSSLEVKLTDCRIYLSGNINYLQMYAALAGDGGSAETYVHFKISSLTSSEAHISGFGPLWASTGSLNVSTLSAGPYTISIHGRATSGTGYLQGFSIYGWA